MLHPIDARPAKFDFDEMRRSYEELQKGIARSNRFPLRPLALAAGLLNTLLLVVTAAVARLFGIRADATARMLGDAYFHVPEMAIQKQIELKAYMAEEFEGTGVDFGCGGGEVGGLLIRAKGLTVHGLDQSPAFEAQVLQNGYAGFTAVDVAKAPLPDHSFDYVISICVLEHVEDLDGALAQARRLVKSGGRLIFSTPQPTYRASLAGARLRRLFGRPEAAEAYADRCDTRSMHFNLLTAEAWAQVLARHGFTLERADPLFSRNQHLIYDLLNWQVYFPLLYTADKLYLFMGRWRLFRPLAQWATATMAEAVSRMPVTQQNATHLFCVARTMAD